MLRNQTGASNHIIVQEEDHFTAGLSQAAVPSRRQSAANIFDHGQFESGGDLTQRCDGAVIAAVRDDDDVELGCRRLCLPRKPIERLE